MDVRTDGHEQELALGPRARLEEDEILRVYDETDYLAAKFEGARIVQVTEPGPGRPWTVVLSAAGAALPQPPGRASQRPPA